MNNSKMKTKNKNTTQINHKSNFQSKISSKNTNNQQTFDNSKDLNMTVNHEQQSQANQNKKKNNSQLMDCPYLKIDAYNLFKQKGDKKSFNFKQVEQKIKQSLMDMDQYGFDFRYMHWFFKERKNGQKKYYKKFNRKIYLRFECPKCRQKGERKKWTSILGNFQIRFQVQQLQKFWKNKPQYKEPSTILNQLKYPRIVKWMVKIYKQYCTKCKGSGIPYVYQSQLKACQIQFCRVIFQIANDIKPPLNKGNRKKIVQVHNHIEQLCQACQKGECFNIPKEESQQKRDGQC